MPCQIVPAHKNQQKSKVYHSSILNFWTSTSSSSSQNPFLKIGQLAKYHSRSDTRDLNFDPLRLKRDKTACTLWLRIWNRRKINRGVRRLLPGWRFVSRWCLLFQNTLLAWRARRKKTQITSWVGFEGSLGMRRTMCRNGHLRSEPCCCIGGERSTHAPVLMKREKDGLRDWDVSTLVSMLCLSSSGLQRLECWPLLVEAVGGMVNKLNS